MADKAPGGMRRGNRSRRGRKSPEKPKPDLAPEPEVEEQAPEAPEAMRASGTHAVMRDDAPPAQEPQASPDDDPRARLESFLTRVIPDVDTVSFRDIAGEEHRANVLLPARVQFRVARRWRSIYDQIDVEDVKRMRDEGIDFQQVIVQILTRLVAEDGEVEELLYWTFGIIHPQAVRSAFAGPAGELAEVMASLDDDEAPSELGAGDAFPMEEMILAIVPFSLRIIQRAMSAMKANSQENAPTA